MPISARMSREIFSTMTRFGQGNCFSIKRNLKIENTLKTKGYTLVPLKMYFRHGKIKVEIGLATGKKLYDKRQDMAAKAAKRDLARRIKEQRYD